MDGRNPATVDRCLSHYRVSTCFNHPRWCRSSSIHSMYIQVRKIKIHQDISSFIHFSPIFAAAFPSWLARAPCCRKSRPRSWWWPCHCLWMFNFMCKMVFPNMFSLYIPIMVILIMWRAQFWADLRRIFPLGMQPKSNLHNFIDLLAHKLILPLVIHVWPAKYFEASKSLRLTSYWWRIPLVDLVAIAESKTSKGRRIFSPTQDLRSSSPS